MQGQLGSGAMPRIKGLDLLESGEEWVSPGSENSWTDVFTKVVCLAKVVYFQPAKITELIAMTTKKKLLFIHQNFQLWRM